MPAEITLADGAPGLYENGQWDCADPKAVPMLEYFTGKVLEEIDASKFPDPDAAIVERVVAKFVGAKVCKTDYGH